MTSPFPNIVCTDHTLGGSPRIDGRRIAVGEVVSFVQNYDTLQEVIEGFDLTIPQIRQTLQYCSALQCKNDKPKIFCHNCSLRRQQVGPLDISNWEEIKEEDVTFVKRDNVIFLGSMEELLKDWQGEDLWLVATDLLIDLRNELLDSLNTE
jgi:uncharacterized protein (DUF433 family)